MIDDCNGSAIVLQRREHVRSERSRRHGWCSEHSQFITHCQEMKGKEIKGWLKAPLNDDLGGLPSRTVLSEEPLMLFAIDPHSPVAPQGLVLAGAPQARRCA